MSQPRAGSDELRLWCAVFTRKVTGWGIITRQHLFLFFPLSLSLGDESSCQIFCRAVFFFFHIHFTEHLIWNLFFFSCHRLFGVFFSSVAPCLCSFHKGATLMAAPWHSAGVPCATASSAPPSLIFCTVIADQCLHLIISARQRTVSCSCVIRGDAQMSHSCAPQLDSNWV